MLGPLRAATVPGKPEAPARPTVRVSARVTEERSDSAGAGRGRGRKRLRKERAGGRPEDADADPDPDPEPGRRRTASRPCRWWGWMWARRAATLPWPGPGASRPSPTSSATGAPRKWEPAGALGRVLEWGGKAGGGWGAWGPGACGPASERRADRRAACGVLRSSVGSGYRRPRRAGRLPKSRGGGLPGAGRVGVLAIHGAKVKS